MPSSREIVLDRQVESILASMATESMSIPKKFVVVAGFVILSTLMVKPNLLAHSNHGCNVVGTDWGVWWANSKVIIQIV